MEVMREGAKRMRAAMSNEDEDTASQVIAGRTAAASSALVVASAEAEEEEMGAAAEAETEAELVGSPETEEQIQRILHAIENFTRQVQEMLEAGRALLKGVEDDFADRLCSIHKERVESWEEEIRELRARDAANEQCRALLHNAQAQIHLLHIRGD